MPNMADRPILLHGNAHEGPVDDAVPWRDRAACRGAEVTVFFPDAGDAAGIAEAKEICGSCLVAPECLSYAVETNQTEGIWGGATWGERRRLRRIYIKELREAG